jgi:hypothetical protein
MILNLNPSREEVVNAIRQVLNNMDTQEMRKDIKSILSTLKHMEQKIDILVSSVTKL